MKVQITVQVTKNFKIMISLPETFVILIAMRYLL